VTRTVAFLSTVISSLWLSLSADPITPVLTPELIDFGLTVAVPGPPDGRTQEAVIIATTTAKPHTGWFGAWGVTPSLARNRHLRLAFVKPLEVGTILGGGGRIGILKPEAPLPGEVESEDLWQDIGEGGGVALTLPPGTLVRAVRFASRLPETPLQPAHFGFSNLLLLKERFYSPAASGAHHSEPGTPNRPEIHVYFWEDPLPIAGVVLGLQRAGLIKIDILRSRFKGHPVTGDERDWQEVAEASGEHCSARIVRLDASPETRGVRLRVVQTSRVGTFAFCLPLVALGDKPVPEVRRAEMPAPFTIQAELPRDGVLAMRVEDPQGNRVRNLIAEVERKKGPNKEPWDLKDQQGRFVAPAEYRWKAILCDPIRLFYETTVYNGSNPPWWAPIPSGGGWLADHCAPQSAAAVGEKVFIGTFLAESGHTIAAVDPDGNKLWGCFSFGAWMGAAELASDGKHAYVGSVPAGDSGITVFQIDPGTFRARSVYEQTYSLELPGGLTGMAAHDGKLYLAYSGRPTPWLCSGLNPGNVDFLKCVPPVPEGAKPEHPATYTDREAFMSVLRAGLPDHGRLSWAGPPAKGRRAEMIIVFQKEQTIGTVLTPNRDVKLSVLKPGRSMPDAPTGLKAAPEDGAEDADDSDFEDTVAEGKETDWVDFPGKRLPDASVGVMAAPEKCATKALKLTFTRPEGAGTWNPTLRWLLMVKRRFRDVADKAAFASPHGAVNERFGFRVKIDGDITPSNPAILAMKWKDSRDLRGVGLIGLSNRCEVDVFAGADQEDPFQFMQSDGHWEKVGAANPMLPSKEMSVYCHPDMHVDFGGIRPVRAVRIRILEGSASVAKLDAVIAYQHLGGDAPEPASLHRRVTVLELPEDDQSSAKLARHVPAEVSAGIAVSSQGQVCAVSGKQVVRLDLSGDEAKATPVVSEGLEQPQGLAFDAQANLYVSDFGTHNIKVFSPDGKRLREIGKPGGRRMGPYDPERMILPRRMAINSRGQLWVAEMDYQPKKVSVWTLDGKLLMYKLGPTQYGGGGWMDPADRSIVRYDGMEFKIDWKTGDWRLANIIYSSGLPGTVHAGRVERTIHLNGHTYVVADAGYQTSSVALVTRYEAERGVCVPLAAAGVAGGWPDFQKPKMRALFGKMNLANYSFLWMDENGDGEADPDEVQLSEKGLQLSGGYWGSRVGEDLALCFREAVLRPVRFKPDGAPVYDLSKRDKAGGDITWRTKNGRTFVIGNQLYDAQGNLLWEYRDDYPSVHGSHRAPRPRPPGLLVGEHGVSGHLTVGKEELFVTNGNHGDWFAFTADGFLAATIFGGPQGYGLKYWSFPQWHRGLEISGLRLYEEHFFGSITKADDDKVYAIAGHNHASVVRVEGLENMTRLEGTFKVSPDDIERVKAFVLAEEALRRNREPAFSRVFQTGRPRDIDGRDEEWPPEGRFVVDQTWNFIRRAYDVLIDAAMAYDKDKLYLLVRVHNDDSPMKNAAQDRELLFKGGDAVDLQLRTGPPEAENEVGVRPGDIRVLISVQQGKPFTMAYRYHVPGTPDDRKRRFASPWRVETVDKVELLAGAEIAWKAVERGYTLEAALPLKELGLKLYPGVRFRGEIGVLYSDSAGVATVNRVYWSNKANHITSDVPSEVRIYPSAWGHFLCAGKSEMDIGAQAADLLKGGKEGESTDATDDVVEDELEKGSE
jgi:hypothetical protein